MTDICIITHLHPSLNPRVVKEADALTEAGYKVSVIAPIFSEWARKADEEFQDRSWRIVERPIFGPLAPWGARLAEKGRRTIAQAAVRRFGLMHPKIVRAAWHPIAPELVAAAMRHKADLYIAHLVGSIPAAAIAARHFGSRYAFDAEDFHLGDLPDTPEYEVDRKMIRSIEGAYLGGCCYTTAASPLIARAYQDEYKIKLPGTVLNVFPTSHAPHCATPRGTAIPGPSVYWFSQTIGPNRGLECAVRAIGKAKTKPHLYLRGQPSAGFLEKLDAIAAEVGVQKRVHVLPRSAPSELERLAATYDIGFVGETADTRNHEICLSNKQFSYLLAGLPMAMSDIPSHRDFSGGHETCIRLYAVDNEHSLANAFDSLLEDPLVLAGARGNAFSLGQNKFNWEIEKRKLLQRVEDAMKQTR